VGVQSLYANLIRDETIAAYVCSSGPKETIALRPIDARINLPIAPLDADQNNSDQQASVGEDSAARGPTWTDTEGKTVEVVLVKLEHGVVHLP
jgi:hypothetical protein